MVLMMACELTFSTPTERGTFPNSRLWGWGSYGPLGAATRSPRRRRPFHFFSRLGFVLDTGSGFGFRTTDDGRTTKPDSPQTPIPRTGNRQKKYRQKF